MSDQSDKQEEATPRKLTEARKKGQVPRSNDVPTALSLVIVVLYFWLSWDWLKVQLKEMLEIIPYLVSIDFYQALSLVFDVIVKKAVFGIMLPFALLMVLAGVIGNVMQFGFLLAFDPIIPKPERLNPAEGLKRIFSGKQVVQTLISLVKTLVLAIILWIVIRWGIKEFLHPINQCNLPCEIELTELLIKKLYLYALPVLIILAVMDYAYQRMQFMKQQRMTKEEVKQEMKDMMGDPHIRGALSGLRKEISEQDIQKRIKTARLLVLDMGAAVALQYEAGVTPLPVIVAIGKGLMARKMVEIAQIENVPTIIDPALAQLLLEEGKIDQYIPESSIERVANAMRKTPKGQK